MPGPRLSLCCHHWRTRGSETGHRRSHHLSRQGQADTHLVIHRVPGHTVHRPHVAAEHRDGVVPLDVVNVDLGGEVRLYNAGVAYYNVGKPCDPLNPRL